MSKSKLFTFLLIFLSFSAIFSFYNFDSASAQGVIWTYNADTNTATASGAGSTNFTALVEADTAGGWGKFTADATGTQILCNGFIVIGDGTNNITFSDIDKQICFQNGVRTASNQILIKTLSNATLTLGTLIDSTTKKTSNGCTIFDLNTNINYYGYMIKPSSKSNLIELYSCVFSSMGTSNWIQATKMYNCIFDAIAYLRYDTYTSGDIFNVIVSGNGYGVRLYNIGGELLVNKINIFSKVQALHFQLLSGNAVINNAYIRMSGGTNYCFRMESTGAYDVYLIDVDTNSWAGIWTGTSTGKVYRQYTFNLNVLNGEITDFVENATVQLWKDSNLIYEGKTNSSGMIPTQTLTYGYYQQATGDTIQNATSPYYLVITHPDWQTYVSRFYITEPLHLTVSMQEPTYTGYTETEKSDYTTIILFVISLILCIIGLALTVPLLPLIALTISVINVLLLTEISVFNILLIILNIIFTVITIVRTKTKNN